MTIQVPYLPDHEIERDTERLLAEYEQTAGESVELPIPVAEITTYHLALRLEFADLHEIFGLPMLGDQPDILGAIWIDKEAVLIDKSLDPEGISSMMGRYRFSVGHEIGHWRLHRSYITKDANQTALFDVPSAPTVICRTSQTKERAEFQADLYAACLLMPKRLVFEAWRDEFGNYDPFILEPGKQDAGVVRPERKGPRMLGEILRDMLESEHICVFNSIARKFAPAFCVSTEAMRIRLEKLGLLLRQPLRQQSMAIAR